MQAIRKTPSLPNYLNEDQVSERLGVSVQLLRKHRWEGRAALCQVWRKGPLCRTGGR